MQSVDFKNFWDKMEAPAHAHSSGIWYDRYALEILFFLSGADSVMDAGCGSGEILWRIAPHFKKVFAIDYSQSMMLKARKSISEGGISHVVFACDNITNIGKHFSEKVDAIYSNGVIQYLSVDELDEFLAAARNLLLPGGRVVLLNIPNINNRILFLLGFYRHEKRVSFYRVLKGLPRLWLRIIGFKLKNQMRPYDDGIGNWFSIEQIKETGCRHGFGVQIYGASVINYNYRFHAVLSVGHSA